MHEGFLPCSQASFLYSGLLGRKYTIGSGKYVSILINGLITTIQKFLSTFADYKYYVRATPDISDIVKTQVEYF